jgi:segregation and condensation protein B
MAKEINLFEQEVESVPAQEEETLPAPKATYRQATLPGMMEKIQAAQAQEERDKQLKTHLKRVIEALFFATSDPLHFDKIREVTDTIHPLKPRFIKELIQGLQQEYIRQNRAFRLEEIAQGYILRTCEEFSPYIDVMHRNKRTEKLSHPSAEVLAIIAYRQPITRPQIEAIRGVDCSGIIYTLLERQLIEPVGKMEAPGRPTLYGITKDFLKHFGLRDLNELVNEKAEVKDKGIDEGIKADTEEKPSSL